MPEGDAVWRTCRRLQQALAGRALTAAELRWPGLSTARLVGLTVTEVVPYGKHILVRFDSGWTLHSHLKMEGQWRVEPTTGPAATARTPERLDRGGRGRRGGLAAAGSVRALLANPEWTALGLRLGRLDLVRTREEGRLIGHLGPDLLADGFDVGVAVANLAASGTSIGAALLDQQNLAGIGTIWSSESLFRERLHPWTPVAQLSEAHLVSLVLRARSLMLAAISDPGPSAITRPESSSAVHGRSGGPCRRCGGLVRVAEIGPPTRERPMFYCPGCQGGLAPNDDGRPIAPLGAYRRPTPGSRTPRERPRGRPPAR